MRNLLYLALLICLSCLSCRDCGDGPFCHRYCQERLGSTAKVQWGTGITDDGTQCICCVHVKLPAQPTPEKTN